VLYGVYLISIIVTKSISTSFGYMYEVATFESHNGTVVEGALEWTQERRIVLSTSPIINRYNLKIVEILGATGLSLDRQRYTERLGAHGSVHSSVVRWLRPSDVATVFF
jgi:hypothetical protein